MHDLPADPAPGSWLDSWLDSAPAPGLVAAALGFGAVVTGLSRGGQAVDGWTESRLAARGVRRPRLWIGLVAAGASLAMSAAEARRPRRGVVPPDGAPAPPGA